MDVTTCVDLAWTHALWQPPWTFRRLHLIWRNIALECRVGKFLYSRITKQIMSGLAPFLLLSICSLNVRNWPSEMETETEMPWVHQIVPPFHLGINLEYIFQCLLQRCCRKKRCPLQRAKSGLLSDTRKSIVQGDTCWQSKRLYWKIAPGWRAAE